MGKMTPIFTPQVGGCTCGEVRYELRRTPLIVHCCHCHWCQRETGASFALNALIEADELVLLQGQPRAIDTPSNSGRGQIIHRCESCQVALWSNYSAAGAAVRFLRVGTLDDPARCPPDIHIFTAAKQPWLQLPNDGVPVVDEYYRRRDYWPADSIARYHKAIGR
jgi:hypothetical protein